MVHLFSLFILLIQTSLSGTNSDLRLQYHKAIYNEDIANSLDANLKLINNKTALQAGYYGANKMVLAKFAFWPNTKYSLFIEGKNLLESAIGIDQKNIELIYLRYSIQLNSPDFLGYNQNKESDKKFLVSKVRLISDKDLKERITRFLIEEGKLSETERNTIQ